MCGILGFINFKNKINKNKFVTALDKLNERGPDSTNFYFSKSCEVLKSFIKKSPVSQIGPTTS